jgi:hypothetical protein
MTMKFLTMVTTTNADRAGMPPPELTQAIMQLGIKAGSKLKDTGGMKDVGVARVAEGALVVDGPYAEAKEAVGGYALYELDTEAQAMDWVRDFIELHRKHWPAWEGEVKLLHLFNGMPPA